tara:strand:- start:1534 stop:1743 length:210 start_codon:yes stop_codon:yes gene_type:complete
MNEETSFWDLPHARKVDCDDAMCAKIEAWCTDNLDDEWRVESHSEVFMFRFESGSEATHFGLKWASLIV